MQFTACEERTAIAELVARFDDAVNRRDVKEFASLWHKDALWEVGEPMPMQVQGADATVQKMDGNASGHAMAFSWQLCWRCFN
jgi:ketosteroid isomerase-like protein